jgi:4-amino-4-deoxy-L-arabinose transferase-like glycosyltransferase
MDSAKMNFACAWNRRNALTATACVALLAAFAGISWCAWLNKNATFDEPLHFVAAWVQTHYGDFRCNPEDPPLWKYYVAAGTNPGDMSLDMHSGLWKEMLLQDPAPAVHFVVRTMYQTPGTDADRLLRAGRARMLALGVVLGAAIAWWAWRLAGRIAAVVAIAAYCFDPNFLAHAPLIKNDVPITLIFFLLMAVIWLLGERATVTRFICVMLLAAVALATKFSGILTLPMLGIALFCRVLIGKPWPFLKWMLSTRLQRLGAALLVLLGTVAVSYAGIWACYGFRFGPSVDPREQFVFHSVDYNCGVGEMLLQMDPPPIYPSDRQLHEWVKNAWKPSIIVRAVDAANRNHLLPQSWLFGFLYTYGSSLYRRTFLCGEIGMAGWWYYFPAAMAFKTPLATLAGLGLASLIWFSHARRGKTKRDAWAIVAVLVCPVFYMAVAMRSHLNIGLRHIFPVYPFLFVFVGVVAAQSFARRPRITGWIAGILFVGLVVETLSAYPNYIPFFNVAAGGSRGGLALLSDSNIDWGQDIAALANWQRDHADRQLYLCQFGLPDPGYYKLHYVEMDGSEFSAPNETVPSGLRPVYAISAVVLQGPYMNPSQLAFYRGFEKLRPFEVLNGTIYLYDSAP